MMLSGKVISFSSTSTKVSSFSSSSCSRPLIPVGFFSFCKGWWTNGIRHNVPKFCRIRFRHHNKYTVACSCEVLKNPSSKEKSGNKDGDYGISVPGEEIGIQVKDDFDKCSGCRRRDNSAGQQGGVQVNMNEALFLDPESRMFWSLWWTPSCWRTMTGEISCKGLEKQEKQNYCWPGCFLLRTGALVFILVQYRSATHFSKIFRFGAMLPIYIQ